MTPGKELQAQVHEMPSVVRPELWGVTYWSVSEAPQGRQGGWRLTSLSVGNEAEAWNLCNLMRDEKTPAYVFSIPAQGARVVVPEDPHEEDRAKSSWCPDPVRGGEE